MGSREFSGVHLNHGRLCFHVVAGQRASLLFTGSDYALN